MGLAMRKLTNSKYTRVWMGALGASSFYVAGSPKEEGYGNTEVIANLFS